MVDATLSNKNKNKEEYSNDSKEKILEERSPRVKIFREHPEGSVVWQISPEVRSTSTQKSSPTPAGFCV